MSERPKREPDSGSIAGSGWLELSLSCPHCGGPVQATPHDVTRACSHCRSLLLVRGDAADVWVQPPAMTKAEEVAALIIEQAVAAFEMEKRRRAADGQTQIEHSIDKIELAAYAVSAGPVGVAALGAMFVADELAGLFAPDPPDGSPNLHQSVANFRRTVTEHTRVIDLRRFLVPFCLRESALSRLEFGRTPDAKRRLQVVTRRLLEAVAMAPPGIGLKGHGLPAARTTIRRLEECDLAGFQWLPRGPAAALQAVDPARELSTAPDFDTMVRDVGLCCQWEATVYRPYLLANVLVRGRRVRALIDAAVSAFMTHPAEVEAKKIRRIASEEPPSATPPARRVLASRCGQCGSDTRLDPRDETVVCKNCQAGLKPSNSGLVPITLLICPPPSPGRARYLPFWRFGFRLRCGAEVFKDLAAWAARLREAGLPTTFAPVSACLFVPAMPWLNHPESDETFVKTSRRLHYEPPNVEGGSAPPQASSSFAPVRLSAPAASGLARAVLASLFDDAAVAHLTGKLLDRFLFKAQLTLDDGALCYVGFEESRNGVRRGTLDLPARVLNFEEDK